MQRLRVRPRVRPSVEFGDHLVTTGTRELRSPRAALGACSPTTSQERWPTSQSPSSERLTPRPSPVPETRSPFEVSTWLIECAQEDRSRLRFPNRVPDRKPR